MAHCLDISVIICTHNNAKALAETLTAFGKIQVPDTLKLELIVVDNASTDGTVDTIRNWESSLGIRYLYEPVKGLSRARNTGLKLAIGEVVLFTDDDVIPCADWLEKMATPLLYGQCDSITGRIVIANHLERPWMQPMHYVWLAAAKVMKSELVGACMGFHRSVLEKVAEFDPELGSGALGFAEESLFSRQLDVAGFSRRMIDEPCVEHHPNASRLVRKEWLSAAKRRGRSAAYVLHHWEHSDIKFVFLRACYYRLKLLIRRFVQPPPEMDQEGAPEWELSYVTNLEKCRGFIEERKRPRNYDKKGLKRKT